jgi:hypothetical protein
MFKRIILLLAVTLLVTEQAHAR